MGGLSVLDLATLTFTTYRHVPGNPHTLPNDVIGGMAMYEGKLYIATQGGLAVFDPEKQQISSFEPNNLKGENPFGMISIAFSLIQREGCGYHSLPIHCTSMIFIKIFWSDIAIFRQILFLIHALESRE
jgi:hypothetical protein